MKIKLVLLQSIRANQEIGIHSRFSSKSASKTLVFIALDFDKKAYPLRRM